MTFFVFERFFHCGRFHEDLDSKLLRDARYAANLERKHPKDEIED
jgi:hypothetical protein